MLEPLLTGGAITPPRITFQGASLVRSPSKHDLSSYFCPRILREQAAVGVGADFLCAQMFGPSPRQEDMLLGFDVHFGVANPNQIPLPLSEILTAVTVFPDDAAQNLGAVCFRLCDPADTACQAGRDPNACRQARGDIHTLADFPQAVANLLVAQGLAAAGGGAPQFTAPRVLAGSALDVVARFSLAPETMIPVIQQLFRQSASELRAGHELNLHIPYRLLGTVFADAGSLGRVAAGFGPVAGDWPIPLQRLVP